VNSESFILDYWIGTTNQF